MPTVALDTGVNLSYVDRRGSQPGSAVVFLPGPTDSWRSYERVLPRLPNWLRAIAISPRGHGDSDKPVTGYSVEDFGSDVVAVLEGLGIERAVLVGHSGSCLVARWITVHRPARIAGLMLEASPVTLGGDPTFETFVNSVVAVLQDPIDPDFARSFVLDTSSDDLSNQWADQMVLEVLKVPATVWHQTFAGLSRFDDTADLARIGVPVLLIWGDRDTLISRDAQEELIQRIPDGQLVVYPGAGHTPRWDAPAAFASDVATMAARVLRAAHPASPPTTV